MSGGVSFIYVSMLAAAMVCWHIAFSVYTLFQVSCSDEMPALLIPSRSGRKYRHASIPGLNIV